MEVYLDNIKSYVARKKEERCLIGDYPVPTILSVSRVKSQKKKCLASVVHSDT